MRRALAAIMVLGAACADSTNRAPSLDRAPAPGSTTPPSAPASTDDPSESHTMQILITIGDRQFGATLRNSAATRDLAAQLPVFVDMVDHGGVEKTGPLPSALSTDGEPEGADPEVGDVG